MHETLRTYHFLSLRRKKHLPFFSCFVKKIFSISQEFVYFSDKNIQASWTILRSYSSSRFVLCLSTIFSFPKYVPQVNTVSPSCSRCIMLYDAYVMQKWCDDVTLCKMIFVSQIYIPVIKHTHFISALTFCCKPPLGASSPFTFNGISVYFSL